MKHFISLEDFTNNELTNMLELAEKVKTSEIKLNKQLFAANLFFEPSTRTKVSFEVAEKRLGMDVLHFIPEHSSVTKGESLYDTAKTFEAIGADVLVIRHEEDYFHKELEAGLKIPVINAGAGQREHPTQSLLDIFTIYEHFGTLENKNITIVGDIKHSRVAHSNAHALERFGAKVYLSAAEEFMDEVLPFPYISIDEAIEKSDTLMLLRVQHERHSNQQQIHDYLLEYGLTQEREQNMKDGAIILHPAPINRGVEIDSELVEGSRSKIFTQMENGVYVRMAILLTILKQWRVIDESDLKKHETNCHR